MYKDFENMGIYDLRNYARSLGVHSPTTKKRTELILSINEIINGKQPSPKKTNKGRPPKHKASEEIILDAVLPNNLFKSSNDAVYKSFLNLNFNYTSASILSDSGKSSDKNILYKGFYKKYNDDFGIAYFKGYMTDYYKENTIILNNLAEQYGVKDGDYIIGDSRYIAEKNVMLATNIQKINDEYVAEEFERNSFDSIAPCYPNQKIALSGNIDFETINQVYPLAKGTRAILNYNNDALKIEHTIQFLNDFSKNNKIRTLLISIDDTPEDVGSIMFKAQDVEVCSLSLSQSREQFFEKVFTYVNNCINRLEFNQDVAIVFYNATKFINAYAEDLIITQNINETSAKILSQNKLKDIFNLSRNFVNSSLTLILLDAPQSLKDNANEIIYFDSDKDNIHINFQTSNAKFVNNILSKDEQLKRENILKNIN